MTNILEKIIQEKKETLVEIKKNNSLSSLEDKIKNNSTFLRRPFVADNKNGFISQGAFSFGTFLKVSMSASETSFVRPLIQLTVHRAQPSVLLNSYVKYKTLGRLLKIFVY